MADLKISQLTAKGTAIASTDLIEISESDGAGGYVTKSVTGANIIGSKQDTLISGTNIKTVNSTTLLGSGNLAVQPTLVSGTNIKTINSNSILGSGDLVITGGVSSVSATTPVVATGTTTPVISLASNYGDTQNPYASKTANNILAAPNGTGGVPTFRAIVAADIPTLNQNTTGTASNVTGIVALANGGTGTASPSLVAGTNITITGTFPNQTIASSGGGGSGGIHAPTILKTGGYYSSCLSAEARTSGAFSANEIVLYPFIPMQTITTSGFLYTNNSAVVGGLARILVYGTLNGLPSNKLYESADINASTTGNKTATSSQTFIAGTTYWLAYATNTLGQNAYCFPITSITSIAGNIPSIFTEFSNLRYTATLGAAPATLNQTLFGFNTGNVPSIFLIAT